VLKLWLKRVIPLAAFGVVGFALPAHGDAVAPLDAISFEIFATNSTITLPQLVSTGTRDNGQMGNASNITDPEDASQQEAFGSHFFSEDLDNASKVVLAQDEVDLPTLPPFGSQRRPSYYTNAAQKAVLHVETGEGALYRSIKWLRKDASSHFVFDPANDVYYNDDGLLLPDLNYLTPVPSALDENDNPASALYFDSLVKFTVVPDGSVPELLKYELSSDEYGDTVAQEKLLGRLLVYINAFDTVGTPSNPDDYEPGWTNLCVKGGMCDEEGQWQESIFTNATPGFVIDPNAWHRLTIRVMSVNAANMTLPVFEIYIDATNESATANKPLKFSHPCVAPKHLDVETGAYGSINSHIRKQILACEFIAGVNAEDIPTTETGDSVLSGVGFRGEGYLDDYVVTTEKPTGIEDVGARWFFTLYWTPQSCMSSTLGGGDDLAYYVGDRKYDCDTDASQVTFEVSDGQTVGFTAKARNFGYYAIVPPTRTINVAGDLSATIGMGLSNFTVYVSAPEGVTLSAVKDGEALPGSVAGEGLGVVVPTTFEGTVTNDWTFSSENTSASPFIKPGATEPQGFTVVSVTNDDLTVSTKYRIASVKPTVNVSASFVDNAGEVLPAFTGLGGFVVWDWLRTTGVTLQDIENNSVSYDAQQASYMFGTDMLGEMPTFNLDTIDLRWDEGTISFTISAHTNATGTVSLYYESDQAKEKGELRGYLAIQYKSMDELDGEFKTATWVLPELQPDGSVKITTREYAVLSAGRNEGERPASAFYRAILTLFKQDPPSGN